MKKTNIILILLCTFLVLSITGCDFSKAARDKKPRETVRDSNEDKTVDRSNDKEDAIEISDQSDEQSDQAAESTDTSVTYDESAPEDANDPKDDGGSILSEDEWRLLALKYFAEYEGTPGSDYIPSEVEVYFDDPKPGVVSIHLFDDMGTHTATANWYEINMKTGKGTDTLGNVIDFGKITSAFGSRTGKDELNELKTPEFIELNERSEVNDVDQLCAGIDLMRKGTDNGGYDGVGANNFRRTNLGEGKFRDELIKTCLSTPEIDDLMKRFGYTKYSLFYYYDNPDIDDEVYSDGPNLIDLSVNGKDYRYYFRFNNLIRRVAPEGTSDNIKTNEFLSELYRIGFEYRWKFNNGTW